MEREPEKSPEPPKLSSDTREELSNANCLSDEDPENYPLNSAWSFWFNRSPRGSDAGDFFANLRHLATVNTIKAFWSVFNNLPSCQLLQERDSYHLMRDADRRPVWEDYANSDGGTWTLKVPKEHSVQLWQEILLAAIGEQLSRGVAEEDEICGVSVSVRYDCDVFQIWHQDTTLQLRAKVVEKVQELVPSASFRAVFYQCNRDKVKDSMMKSSSSRGRSPGSSKSYAPPASGRSPPSQGPVFGPGMVPGAGRGSPPRVAASSSSNAYHGRPGTGGPSPRMGPNIGGPSPRMGPGGPGTGHMHRYASPVHPSGLLGNHPGPHSQPQYRYQAPPPGHQAPPPSYQATPPGPQAPYSVQEGTAPHLKRVPAKVSDFDEKPPPNSSPLQASYPP